ncbi:hypothetical protein B0I26_12134 [Anoxybacillus vitaminiphilus]|uniref:Uncharacterized protein n=1 Tax=Paranoxybacillus vitaminiphilus TaxID=581036 RepID=A0A327Y3Y7_9BACL|nr:hypothetical protein [Anoxybacillus vitaminiphilus]RAK15464.1 hypothetical protein B0I26_12134 [Anoxybacillus vitaminiphilus]
MLGIFVYLLLCLIVWGGAHIAIKTNAQSEREYYNENDPFKTFFM